MLQLLPIVYGASPSLPKLQVRMLHLQYALLSPIHGSKYSRQPTADSRSQADEADIWELSGAALRLAIDLGCHHERGNALHDTELDMRRRLFWSYIAISCYLRS